MGGLFGVVSDKECIEDLFYGTDYHSHLGTQYGGMVVMNEDKLKGHIHKIKGSPFRTSFRDDIQNMPGKSGIGVISDYEVQPLNIKSHLGNYAIAIVGKLNNIEEIENKILYEKKHLVEMSHGDLNPTEIISTLIDEKKSFEEGIEYAQSLIEGSCTLLILAKDGIYAARDSFGRTPLIVGKKNGSYGVASETCAFHNLDFDVEKELGPGEIVKLTKYGTSQLKKPNDKMKICSFLWVYYGNPSSSYEGVQVEGARQRCGAALAKRDNVSVDTVAAIPDSGTAHAVGYANEKKIPFSRPLVKYIDTWQRSFMPQEQKEREVVAKMKLLQVKDQIEDKKLLFCDDSIVRGTQLKDIVKRMFEEGKASEVHMRPACPPLTHGCKYLNFSRSRNEFDLAPRRAIRELKGSEEVTEEELARYSDPDSEEYKVMVDKIRQNIGLTSLQYQRLDDLIKAIGLPKEKLCTYCWNGKE